MVMFATMLSCQASIPERKKRTKEMFLHSDQGKIESKGLKNMQPECESMSLKFFFHMDYLPYTLLDRVTFSIHIFGQEENRDVWFILSC